MTDLESQFANLKAQLLTAESEFNSLKLGRKSACPRLRKSLMALKNSSHGMRKNATEYVRELPTKTRQKVIKEVEEIPDILEPEVELLPASDSSIKKARAKKKTAVKQINKSD
jgi:hypothetical protein